MASSNTPDPAAKPKRRTFSAEYKLAVIAEHDACSTGAERSALLRRERLYHSHIQDWRNARDTGALQNLADGRTAPKTTKPETRYKGTKSARSAPVQHFGAGGAGSFAARVRRVR